MSRIEELRARTIPTANGCWEWQGTRQSSGYGMVRIQQKGYLVHRLMWELARGESIPEGHQIDHLCRNRACVNPNHLEPVTPSVNSHRSPILAARWASTTCVNGHPKTPENRGPVGKYTRCLVCHRERERARARAA